MIGGLRWPRATDQHGNTYWYARREMPELPAQLLDAVIYLYRSKADAEAGEKTGGTGFLVPMPSDGDAPLFVMQ